MGRARVIVLGSGWAGNKLARKLDKSKFDVRIVSPSNHFLFTPLLPSAAVGTLEFRAIQEPVRTIAGLGEYYQAKAVSVDEARRRVSCDDLFSGKRFEVAYDYLVVAAGCKTNTFGTAGVDDERADLCFLKHLYHARKIRNRVLECFERASNPALSEAERDALLSFVVVGAGATSCEFTTELSDFVAQDVARWYPKLAPRVRLTLVEAGPKILSVFDDALVSYYAAFLEKRGVDVRVGVAVDSIESPGPDGGASAARLADGSTVRFGLCVWSAGLAPVNFVVDAGFPTDRGRVVVDDYLRVRGRVFALGDCAVAPHNVLPPTASVAEQHAAYLAHCFNASYASLGPDDPLPDRPLPVAPAAMPTVYLEPLDALLFDAKPHFRYVERGAMASMGMWRGIADLSKTDLPGGGPKISGFAAFVAWRGAYLSKQLSLANMILVPMFWFKSWLFGRDISRF